MELTIPFTSEEEERLTEVAQREGFEPAEWLRQLVLERISTPISLKEKLYATLRERQRQDGTPLHPHVPAQELFARWAEEDAKMTDEEREEQDRLWEEIEKGILENRGVLRLRSLSE